MDVFFASQGPLALLVPALAFLVAAIGGRALWWRNRRLARLNRDQGAELDRLRSDLQQAAQRLDSIDPARFQARLAAFERSQNLAGADTLVERFFDEQAGAIADAARVMAEREVFLSHNRGADGLPDAVRYAELGLAARPGDAHLAALLEELRAKIRHDAASPAKTIARDDSEEPPQLQELDDIDLLAIARQCLGREQYGLAGITARRAAALAHHNIGPRTSRHAAALNMQSEALQAMGRLEDAVPPLQDAVEIAAETLGVGDPNYAVGLRNLADLLQRAGRLGEAETCLRQVLALRERSLGTHHPDYAADFSALKSLENARAQAAPGASPLTRAAAAAMSQGSLPANASREPQDQLFRTRRASAPAG